MSPTTKVAIVGSGDIAQTAHLPAWAAENRAEVTWVVDVDADVAQKVAAKWSVPHWSTDYREALADADVDAADICLPGRLHVDCVVDSLQAGKHVLVEKPVALTLEHAQRMAEVHAGTDLVLMVAENWPYSSAYRAASQAISEGLIGRPFLLQSSHRSDLRLARLAGSGKGDRDYAGYFFAAGVHAVNLAREIMGPVREIHAYANSVPGKGDLPLDDDFVTVLQFERGGIGSLDLSGRSRHVGPRRLEFRVLGDKGLVEFDVWSGWVQVTSGDAVTRLQPQVPSVGYHEETAHFLDCIEHGGPPSTGIEGQLETLAIVFAGYQSLETKRPVRPADVLAGATSGSTT